MKDGDRGWISVKALRELLIEIPGEYMVTPLNNNHLHVANSGRGKHLGDIDFITEKAKMKAGVDA